MTAQSENDVAFAFTRRRLFAAGAAGLAAVALAACSGEEIASTATRVSGTVSAAGGTVAAVGGTAASGAATQVPGVAGGLASTAGAVASQNPGLVGTVQAAGSAVVATGQAAGSAAVATGVVSGSAVAATGGDPASRNNKYAGKMPPMTIDRAKKYFATITTNKGTMRAELYADTAPITVNNFVFLANEKFYDDVIFHRIVATFVIQGGDPTGTGTGGPGYKFADEPIPATRTYDKGTLAMANSGANTNGSQFFLCLDGAKMALERKYNLFGKIVEGLDVVDSIAKTPVRANPNDPRMERSQPTERVFMQSVTISTQ